MVSDKNEKGITLIEAAFVLLLFCVIFPISIYYISLTMTVSKAINLGELMYLYGSRIEYAAKSGECVCTSATEECAECLEKVLDGMIISSEHFSKQFSVYIKNKNSSGISVLILPKDTEIYSNTDTIYFTLAATKEKAVIIQSGYIQPINRITPFIRGVYDNSDKNILAEDFGLSDMDNSCPGIYFEVSE